MEPLSQLFAAYLHTINNTIASVHSDIYNTTITSKSLVYKGSPVHFQYQLWKIKPQSVCADLKQNSTQYSQCTQLAKNMFTELCTELSSMDNLNNKGRQVSNMYCNASINYKPMVAYISAPKPKSEQEQRQKACNELILKAMQDKSEATQKQKEAACTAVN